MKVTVNTQFNVLLSSAGRRVTLLNLFREAIAQLKLTSKVVATDVSPLAAAWKQADIQLLVPRCDSRDYVPAVLDVCRRHDIKLLVPTIDTELAVLADHRNLFEAVGTTLLTSSSECIRIAADKVHTHRWLIENGFPTVRQTSVADAAAHGEDWPLPLIAKPRDGSSSVGLMRVTEPGTLGQLCHHGNYIVQTIAAGREHTVDVLVNRDGRVVCAVPRRRIEVRAGEVSKAVTVRSKNMEELATAVCERLPGAYGPLNVQMFEADDGTLAIVEINARFGGGFPLTAHAGANFPRWIIEELLGFACTASTTLWKSAVGMLRYDAEVFFDYERAMQP